MSLEIYAVNNHGDASEEFVSLKVLEDTNLRNFLILDSTYEKNGRISNKLRHAHWFEAKDVKKGDFVRLYTGKGTSSSNANKSKTRTHWIYWGLDTPVWNDAGDTAVLFHLLDWQPSKVQ